MKRKYICFVYHSQVTELVIRISAYSFFLRTLDLLVGFQRTWLNDGANNVEPLSIWWTS